MPGKKRRPRAESGADPGAVPALAPAVAQSVQEPMVRLGTIVGPHGIRGAVRVKTYTEDPMSIAAYGPVFDRAGARRFALRVLGPAKAGALAVIDGVSDRNAAEAMRGLDLYVPRHALPETADEDEFYNADLIGLQVEDMAGRPLGRVCDVADHGAGPILDIRGDADLLLPFTREAVPVVDLAAGRLQVVVPAELPPEDEPAEGERVDNAPVPGGKGRA